MPLPKMDPKLPLCYDPARQKFILYEDLVSGREKAIPLRTLSRDDLKKLVIEWRKHGPDYAEQDGFSGRTYRRADVIRAIELDEPYGRKSVQVGASYLQELLDQIEANVK
jgi:hypothetical protein